MSLRLTFTQAQARFAKYGQCDHDPEFEQVSDIPNSDVHIKNCSVCGKELERWYD